MIRGGMFSTLADEIERHDKAWMPVLEAIKAGDIQTLKAGVLDPATGSMRLDLVQNASFGVQNPWAGVLGQMGHPPLRAPRMSILLFCFKAHRADAARAILEMPMPEAYADDGRVAWLRRLSSVISFNGTMTEQDFAYQMATSKPELGMPFLELVVEQYPAAPGLAKAAKVDADTAARITVAQMNVRIRQADGVDQVLATAAPTVNRRRAL